MNNFSISNFFISDTITNIVYSSYLQDYYIFFALLLSGYIAIVYFLGYLLGKIPYINRLFNYKKFLTFLVILPLLIILVKLLLLQDGTNIFLEKFLFITIFTSFFILLFVYAGTKELLKNNYGLIRFYNDYTFAIVVIVFSSYYYYKTQAISNLNYATKIIKNNIHKEMIQLQNTNGMDYRLSKLIVNYYIKSIDNYTNTLAVKERKIIDDFNSKIINYDNQYILLSENIISTNKLIVNLETSYKNKIRLVDNDIDEEKLRLKSIYQEWKNNVITSIDNLEKLSNKYSLEIKTLENNKDSLAHLQKKLKLIKEKNIQLNMKLLKVNDLISQNKTDINSQKEFAKKLSKEIKNDINNINKVSLKNTTKINTINKTINKKQTKVVKNNNTIKQIENKKQNLSTKDNNLTIKKN
jgi:hypothetical protein